MPRNTSVVLSDHFNAVIARAVASGRYDYPSDVVGAGLWLPEEEEHRLDRLHAEDVTPGCRKGSVGRPGVFFQVGDGAVKAPRVLHRQIEAGRWV